MRTVFALAAMALASSAIFAWPAQTSAQPVLHTFTGGTDDGWNPRDLASDGSVLYGTTTQGGATDNGVLYSMNADGSNFKVLHSFGDSSTGKPLVGGLTIAGSTIYGVADARHVYSIHTDGTGFQVLHDFDVATEGGTPFGGLFLEGSTLYGTVAGNGPNGHGSVYAMNTDGSDFHVLNSFPGFTAPSSVGSVAVAGSRIYSASQAGGTSDLGTVFSMNLDGSDLQILHTFDDELTGGGPLGVLIVGSRLYGTTNSAGILYSMALDGSDYQVLHEFHGAPDGAVPNFALTAVGSTLYGSTFDGGDDSDLGTLFSINTDGSDYNVDFRFADGLQRRPISQLQIVGSQLIGLTRPNSSLEEGGAIYSITVPEPASWLLLSIGGAWCLWSRRRRRAA